MNGTNQIPGGSRGRSQPWPELAGNRNRRLQRRRPFRHPFAKRERPGGDLGNERDQYYRRGVVSPNPGPSWKAIGTGDFNGDGDSDILFKTINGQTSIWEMNGDHPDRRRCPSAPILGRLGKQIGTGDFNADGHSDILLQNTSSGQASIWEMNGTTLIGGGLAGPDPGPTWTPSEPAISMATAIPTSCGRTIAVKPRSGR